MDTIQRFFNGGGTYISFTSYIDNRRPVTGSVIVCRMTIETIGATVFTGEGLTVEEALEEAAEKMLISAIGTRDLTKVLAEQQAATE